MAAGHDGFQSAILKKCANYSHLSDGAPKFNDILFVLLKATKSMESKRLVLHLKYLYQLSILG